MDNQTLDIKKDNKLSQLKAILYLLQTNLEEFKEEVDASYALLTLGEKTPLAKKLEKKIQDPINDIFQFSNKIDSQVNQILDTIIRGYFKKNHSSIKKVFKTRKSLNDLHYSIVLKEDNVKSRDVFFEFLNTIDLANISQKHNVYFQFIPSELVDKIKFDEEIKFE
ncbi:hypothetical protein ERX46_15560 [Brumimicrobium glaciale]|uniref:Uncharacterized protein n=1 Tax=Brumimicrobium glaciale TaxID=200475 RepID=A0A4Q4KH02_9FLAO|nr:hypothetical protein [Brumimicrobium glaciale]RYM32098.1 hypothetical protein ERX46_15560 [Brumimicrobium glaciale]